VSAIKVVRWLAVGFVAGGGVAFAATGTPLLGERLWRAIAERGADVSPPVRPRAPARAPATAAASVSSPEVEIVPQPEPPSGSVRPAGDPPHVAFAESPTTDPKWRRAAAALKARDYPAAENALREVETTGTPGDRDAASLALAQVLLTRGRVVEARARLERLRQRAGSALVREKATTLLAELSSSGGRSFAPPSVPQ
jgi:hypothetical protein